MNLFDLSESEKQFLKLCLRKHNNHEQAKEINIGVWPFHQNCRSYQWAKSVNWKILYQNKYFVFSEKFEQRTLVFLLNLFVYLNRKLLDYENSCIAGDLLGPTVNNLDKLLRMPQGCGEQNMLNFVPNIVITKYLKRVNRLNKAIEKRALHFMESGKLPFHLYSQIYHNILLLIFY